MIQFTVNGLTLYHGSIFNFKEPNLEKPNFRTDFGKGFYTTADIEQAKKWAIIKKERFIKNSINNLNVKSYVNIYDYIENNDLKVLNFADATEEW